MSRLIFILLATLSIVNAIPLHTLHKRAVEFIPCPIDPAPAPLTVTMDPPDPNVGKTNSFTVSGKFPVEQGAMLVIGYFSGPDAPVGKAATVLNVCEQITCPAEEINLTVPEVPAPTQEELNANPKTAIIALVTTADGKTPAACAGGGVPAPADGGAGGDASPAGGDAPPAGGDAPPAGGDAPPADGAPADGAPADGAPADGAPADGAPAPAA